MRIKYCVTSSRDVRRPAFIAFCISGIVASTMRNAAAGAGRLWARTQVQSAVDALARSYGGRVLQRYEHALRGFAVNISATGAAALARNPRVRYVEQDSLMFASFTETNATWGLDRIDQRDLPLDA